MGFRMSESHQVTILSLVLCLRSFAVSVAGTVSGGGNISRTAFAKQLKPHFPQASQVHLIYFNDIKST